MAEAGQADWGITMENETRVTLIAIIEQVQREAKDAVGSMNNGFAAWCADKLLVAGVAPAQGWISVTERLPDENEKVLIYARVGIITVGWYTELHGVSYNKGFETESGFMWLGTVPYWKPLPEAPKEDADA